MSDKKEFSFFPGLFQGFLRRNNIPKAKIDNAFLSLVIKETAEELFNTFKNDFSFVSYRNGEVVIGIKHPIISSEARLRQKEVLSLIREKTKGVVLVSRVRIVGRG